MNLKKIATTISLLFIFLYSNKFKAQAINWNNIDSTKHFLHISNGVEHAVFYSLGYSYNLKTKPSILLSLNFSIPYGENFFDDFKSRIGGQMKLYQSKEFFGMLSLQGIYRRFATEYVVIQNFGSDVKGTFGFFKPKWFIAIDVGFDKAIVSHFKHSQKYRDEIYNDVTDGWYEPSTGGNFYYGLQTGFGFNKSEISLNMGKLISQDFKTNPLIPIYINLIYTYKI